MTGCQTGRAMRLLSRLLLLLLLVFPATLLLRGGPGGEEREWVAGLGREEDETPATASLKLEAAAAPGSGVRPVSLFLPIARPPARSTGVSARSGRVPAGASAPSTRSAGQCRATLLGGRPKPWVSPLARDARLQLWPELVGPRRGGRRRGGSGHSCTPSASCSPLYFFGPPPLHPHPLWADVSLASTLGALLHSFSETFGLYILKLLEHLFSGHLPVCQHPVGLCSQASSFRKNSTCSPSLSTVTPRPTEEFCLLLEPSFFFFRFSVNCFFVLWEASLCRGGGRRWESTVTRYVYFGLFFLTVNLVKIT